MTDVHQDWGPPKFAEAVDLGSSMPAGSIRHQVLFRRRALLPKVQSADELCHHGAGDGATDAHFLGYHRNVSCARVSDGRVFGLVLVRQRRIY